MAPEKTKEEHKYVPPSFVDKKFIKTLSKEKQQYWANRILGRSGQGDTPSLVKLFKESGVSISFNNHGEMVANNRAARRNWPKTPGIYTKATHSIKKQRGKKK